MNVNFTIKDYIENKDKTFKEWMDSVYSNMSKLTELTKDLELWLIERFNEPNDHCYNNEGDLSITWKIGNIEDNDGMMIIRVECTSSNIKGNAIRVSVINRRNYELDDAFSLIIQGDGSININNCHIRTKRMIDIYRSLFDFVVNEISSKWNNESTSDQR